MRELKLFREIERREAARQSGRNPHNPYHLLIHVKFGAGDADHLALPEDTANAIAAQNADGTFPFMAGYDSVGDPLHPVGG